MASYFDLQPRPSKAAAPSASNDGNNNNNKEEIETLGLLTPQVTRILDTLDLENKSGSEDDSEDDDNHDSEASLSGTSEEPDKDTKDDRKPRSTRKSASSPASSPLRKAHTSPLPRSSRKQHSHKSSSSKPQPRPGYSDTPKQPHLARFQSLRSMLFNSRIEENMEKMKAGEAETRWKEEFEGRRGWQRPKTPEDKEREEKGALRRMGSRLRRLGSKDVQTMGTVREGEVVQDESTASSDDDGEEGRRGSSDIDHEDIEDLVRWVSRRDPPSDGEARVYKSHATTNDEPEKENSGNESLGHSDVDGLVRWVSRREASKTQLNSSTQSQPQPPSRTKEKDEDGATYNYSYSYSDASTESDSEGEGTRAPEHRTQTMNENDVDDLVRWISRKDGPNAGPVLPNSSLSKSNTAKHRDSGTGSSLPQPSGSSSDDEDTAELVRWVTRRDDTSGESDGSGVENQSQKQRGGAGGGVVPRMQLESTNTTATGASLKGEDVDDLVRWVSRGNREAGEEKRKGDGPVKWRGEKDGLLSASVAPVSVVESNVG